MRVINVTGLVKGAKTTIDLSPYLDDKIGQLGKVKILSHKITPGASLGSFNTTIALLNSGGVLRMKTGKPVIANAILLADKTVDAAGRLVAAGTTCAAGHALLSDRKGIMLGDALVSNDMLQITVLYQKDAGGLF